jgi:prophage DNA circulation protein
VLDEHTSFMNSISGTVQGIQQDINGCYKARSSTTFQNKINEWIESYQGVRSAVEQLRESLASAHSIIGRAEEELAQEPAGWSTSALQDPSDPIYQALQG